MLPLLSFSWRCDKFNLEFVAVCQLFSKKVDHINPLFRKKALLPQSWDHSFYSAQTFVPGNSDKCTAVAKKIYTPITEALCK